MFESNPFINVQMHANVFFDAVCKTAFISLVSINLTQKQSPGVQLQLLYHEIRFDPDEMKSVGWNSSLVVFGLTVLSVAGSILLWENFPVEGIFPLELTWVQTPFPKKLFRMRV